MVELPDCRSDVYGDYFGMFATYDEKEVIFTGLKKEPIGSFLTFMNYIIFI